MLTAESDQPGVYRKSNGQQSYLCKSRYANGCARRRRLKAGLRVHDQRTSVPLRRRPTFAADADADAVDDDVFAVMDACI